MATINKKQYNKKWALEHREERAIYKKNYNLSHQAQIKASRKEYYLKHKKEEIQKAKIYQEKHKEELQLYRIKNKKRTRKYKLNYDRENKEKNFLYRQKNKKSCNKRLRKYMKNPTNRILRNLRIRLWSLLKGKNKSASTTKLLGCSIEYLKQHLQSKFKTGMSWDNYGKYGWHVDHIKQCASFDLSKASEQSKCFHYTNLRPLWAKENLSRPRFKKLI